VHLHRPAGERRQVEELRLVGIDDLEEHHVRDVVEVEIEVMELGDVGGVDPEVVLAADVAAEAQARALQALVAAGTTAGQIRGQDYGEQANRAQAENAIDLFNKQTLNQTNLYNVDAANKAQAANLANAQSINNANTNVANTEKVNNAAARQQIFQDEAAKASGKAGVFNSWANDAIQANRSEKAADQALLGDQNGLVGEAQDLKHQGG